MPGFMSGYLDAREQLTRTAFNDAQRRALEEEIKNAPTKAKANELILQKAQQEAKMGEYKLADAQRLESLASAPATDIQMPQASPMGMPGMAAAPQGALQMGAGGGSYTDILGLASGADGNAAIESYMTNTRDQQKMQELLQDRQRADARYKAIVHDATASKHAKDARDKIDEDLKALQDKQVATQEANTKKIYNPLIAGRDDISWGLGVDNLAREMARAQVADAMSKQNIPADQARAIEEGIYDSVKKSLPQTYDANARALQGKVQQQIEGSESRRKEQDSDSQRIYREQQDKQSEAQTRKLKIESDKALADKKSGTELQKEKHARINNLRQLASTQSLIISRPPTDEEIAAQGRLKKATDAVTGIWNGWNPSEKALKEQEDAQLASDNLAGLRTQAQKILTKTQQDLELELGMGEAQGIEPPPEENPISKVDLSGYETIGLAEGWTPQEVLADVQNTLEQAGKDASPEKVLEAAIKSGYLLGKDKQNRGY